MVRGDLTLQTDTKYVSNSSKDESKNVNKNQDEVHDGAVDNITHKPPKEAFNITDRIHMSKDTKKATTNNREHLETMPKIHLGLLDQYLNTHLWVNLLK